MSDQESEQLDRFEKEQAGFHILFSVSLARRAREHY